MTPSSEFRLFYGPTVVAPTLGDAAASRARAIVKKLERGYEPRAFVFPESRRFLLTMHEDLVRRLELGRHAEVESIVEELLGDRPCLESYIEPLTRTLDDYVDDLRALLGALQN